MENVKPIVVNQEFAEVHGIITQHRIHALQAVNLDNLQTAWEVGKFISVRLKDASWGSKTVTQLSEYLRTQDPSLRGYSRRNMYNMVALYDIYSSAVFLEHADKLKLEDIARRQLIGKSMQSNGAKLQENPIFQLATGKLDNIRMTGENVQENAIVQSLAAQLHKSENIQTSVQPQLQQGLFPNFLSLTTLSNHYEIINACKTIEERIFYVLYSYKERLNKRELQRCLKTNVFASLMGDKHNVSRGMKEIYPQSVAMLKDTLFLDFLDLPKRHSEKQLQHGILDHMKEFVLELGKDFLFVGKEEPLRVGNSTFKVDLLFFHRGLRCLVAIELKSTPFKPEYMGQLEFYLEALDRDVRRSDENPSIGILLCHESDKNVVEYAMSRSLSPSMISEYEQKFISKEVFRRSLSEFTGFFS